MSPKRRTPPALLAVGIGVLALALIALAVLAREDGQHARSAGAAMVRML